MGYARRAFSERFFFLRVRHVPLRAYWLYYPLPTFLDLLLQQATTLSQI